MAAIRTITVTRKEALELSSPLLTSWIVRVDGHEFTHGSIYAMPFDSVEDAAEFVADLRIEYGSDTLVEIVGLDDLGLEFLPLEEAHTAATETEWQAELEVLRPSVMTAREKTLQIVTKALFSDGSAEYRLNLILGLWRHDLLPSHIEVLRSLDAAFVLARLKITLPASFVGYAELDAEFRRWRERSKSSQCN